VTHEVGDYTRPPKTFKNLQPIQYDLFTMRYIVADTFWATLQWRRHIQGAYGAYASPVRKIHNFWRPV